MHMAPLHRRLALVAIASTVACAQDSPELPSGVPFASPHVAEDPPRFSDWSAPANLGPMVNSDQADMNPEISKDGLSLFFWSNRPDGTSVDVWVSQRTAVDAPWGAAQHTTVERANAPALSPDEHRLFFNSAQPGGLGGQDLWVSRRRDRRDDFGWQAPVNLGDVVNTSANEVAPVLFEDDLTGTLTLYFASNRPGGPGGNDIYAATMLPDGSFGAPVLIAELSTSSDDTPGDIRRDGLEMFIASSRPGSVGGIDLWVAVRASPSDPWSTPVNLGPVVNSTFNEGGAVLSRDGTALYFHSNANRPGAIGHCFGEPGPCFFDNYVTTRRKLVGSN